MSTVIAMLFVGVFVRLCVVLLSGCSIILITGTWGIFVEVFVFLFVFLISVFFSGVLGCFRCFL